MTTKTNSKLKTHDVVELKILFEALNQAPSYLSKRFILKHLMGWSDEDLKLNLQMLQEESDAKKQIGAKGY
jgi:hypothetical protein